MNQFKPSFPQRTIYVKQEKCVVKNLISNSSLADLKRDSKKRLGKNGAETGAYETTPYVILVNHGNSNFNIILHPKANLSKWACFLQHDLDLESLILSKAVITKREITLTLGHYLIADLGIFLFGNILSTKANYCYAFQPVKWTVSQIKSTIKQEDCLCSTMSWENKMLKKEKAKETLYGGHRLLHTNKEGKRYSWGMEGRTLI